MDLERFFAAVGAAVANRFAPAKPAKRFGVIRPHQQSQRRPLFRIKPTALKMAEDQALIVYDSGQRHGSIFADITSGSIKAIDLLANRTGASLPIGFVPPR